MASRASKGFVNRAKSGAVAATARRGSTARATRGARRLRDEPPRRVGRSAPRSVASTRYAAFLRAINLGSRNRLTMQDLRATLTGLGYSDVKTYLQSGNATFVAPKRKPAALAAALARAIAEASGLEIEVFVRTLDEIEALARAAPFASVAKAVRVKRFVTFLPEKFPRVRELPLVSPHGDVEVFRIEKQVAFSLSRERHGRRGFPNNFLEERLGVPTTTRSWDTVLKMLK